MTEIDEIMLDYEGRESNYMVGLGESDNPPLFGDQSQGISGGGGDDSSFSEGQNTFYDNMPGAAVLSVAGTIFLQYRIL